MTDILSSKDSFLIGCHAVIEGKQATAMGKVTYVEGEIFEVEFPQFSDFHPGDLIRVIIYSSQGLLQFRTTVIAKDTGTIILLTPPEMLQLFMQRRNHPRISVDIQGLIYTVTDASLNKTNNLSTPCKIEIDNISLSGIGFLAEGLNAEESTVIFAELKFEHPVLCPIQIIHKERMDQGMYFGGKFIGLKQQQINTIRALILKHQIEIYCEHKNNKIEKQQSIPTDIKKEEPLQGQRTAKA